MAAPVPPCAVSLNARYSVRAGGATAADACPMAPSTGAERRRAGAASRSRPGTRAPSVVPRADAGALTTSAGGAAAGQAAGGTDEGQPGFRAAYGAHFYVAYLRNPQGNKIALFSSNPNEPGRDGP